MKENERKKYKFSIENRYKKKTYIVDDARLVSSCFNWPSNAKPRLSLFSDNNGFRL